METILLEQHPLVAEWMAVTRKLGMGIRSGTDKSISKVLVL